MSDGSLVCLACSGFMVLDRELGVKYESGKPSYNLAVGTDDTIYTVQLPNGFKTAVSETPVIELAAFEPGGAVRWTQPLPGGSFAWPLAAVPQGVYVATNDDGLAFFAAATGERRAMSPQALLAADRNGLFTMTPPARSTRAREATIRRLDATGASQWERTWKAATEGIMVSAAVATPDGGVIIAGSALEPIDFGDRTLSMSDGALGGFLIAIDVSGATKWAYWLPRPLGSTMYLALMPSGDALLAGGTGTGKNHDAYLAVANSTGILRTHRIEGAADQDVNGLASTSDGLAWLELENWQFDSGPYAEMRYDGHEFNDVGYYVFEIVP